MQERIYVLALNTFLRPQALGPFARDGQQERVSLLAEHLNSRRYDAVILSEVFDDGIRRQLRRSISASYGFQTRIVNSSHFLQNGGVFIASRYPIERTGFSVFSGRIASGTDALAAKGVAYACVLKGGHRYHIFGSHTDAGSERGDLRARFQQFLLIQHYVLTRRISRSEPVLIGGDLNVDRYSSEYSSMLSQLRAHPPDTFEGHAYTYDPRHNDLADSSEPPQYLDYVLWSHKRPVHSRLLTQVFRSPWRLPPVVDSDTIDQIFGGPGRTRPRRPSMGELHRDLSDHYGVCGVYTYDFSEDQRVRGFPGTLHPHEVAHQTYGSGGHTAGTQ